MYYPEGTIEELRSRSDIVDVISGYVRLARKGSSYMGLCPFHGEKTPSFSVNPARQSYHCFGCGVGGDVFSFVMEYERKSFNEAVEQLAERAGMELPKRNGEAEDRRAYDTKKRLLEIHRTAAVYYYQELYRPEGKQALAYLKKRGLSNSTIQSFGLGYSGKRNRALYGLLRDQGYSDAELKASGLIVVDEAKNEIREKFWNRVMFPIMDGNRRVIGFGGRVMGDAKPKYLNSPETLLFDKSANLYGLYAARVSRRKNFILCEGYMDVISLHMHGFTNAVATLGTALTARQASLLHRYTKEVLLMYDSDEAGIKAALRAIPILRSAGIAPKVVSLAPYKDPDELLNEKGRELMDARLSDAENGFLFEIAQLYKAYDTKDPEGVSAFQHETAKRLAGFSDEIERENYLKTIAGVYHIDETLLRRQIGRLDLSGYAEKSRVREERPEARKNRIRHPAEEALIAWMAERPELIGTVAKYLTPEGFSEGVNRRMAQRLLAADAEKGKPAVSVLNLFEDAQERAEAAQVLESTPLPEREEEQEKALFEAIIHIKSAWLEQAAGNADPEDMAAFQRIMEEKRQLELLKKRLSGGR